ncbi:citrulline utilization hydrolase CtlX [uncultured Litoreibacter sp.]|uniref:citrulline utilization hydrolase CtlX n=1 Tax=uncultured Litoreibacter sp. TaxID=1392394 RepID=UPI00261F4E00|nr:arginine deiminase-related protein [uncultured Litoreibacter sp.]
MRSAQAPNAVVMIRPHHFTSNPQTLGDNGFQSKDTRDPSEISNLARAEFDTMVVALRKAGVTVHDFDDTGTTTPDSVFPNNWFSTHAGGHLAVYPMYAKNRRAERRWDIIEALKAEYRVQDVIDFSGLEQDGVFLEGTGAMVLDHIGRVAYTVQSNRADPVILERFCTYFNYEPMAFAAADRSGTSVYHTNVLMTVGTGYVLICDAMITDSDRRTDVMQRLAEGGRDVISLSHAQIDSFAGNAFELSGKDGLVLALSQTAYDALTPHQLSRIQQHATPLPLAVPTIETAGGSVRCMLAGVHLARRPEQKAS